MVISKSEKPVPTTAMSPIGTPSCGRELGVRYVLEGSIRRAGNRVRITCQLMAATGRHLWDLRAANEITLNVVGAIEPSYATLKWSI